MLYPALGLDCTAVASLLTQEQTDAYHRDGFVLIPGLHPAADVARIRVLIEADRASGG